MGGVRLVRQGFFCGDGVDSADRCALNIGIDRMIGVIQLGVCFNAGGCRQLRLRNLFQKVKRGSYPDAEKDTSAQFGVKLVFRCGGKVADALGIRDGEADTTL